MAQGYRCNADCTWAIPHIGVSWQFIDVDPTGAYTVTGCPEGLDTVAMSATTFDANDVPVSSCDPGGVCSWTGTFPCSDDFATTIRMSGQRFHASINVQDASGMRGWGSPKDALLELPGSDESVSFYGAFVNNGGHFRMNISLISAMLLNHLKCGATSVAASAGGSIEIDATLEGTTTTLRNRVRCDDPLEDVVAYSAPLPAGIYTVQVQALDASDQPVGAPDVFTHQTVASGDSLAQLFPTLMIPGV